MNGKQRAGEKIAPIIIRRDEGEEAGHHGGAWKVAYADFVTAMMAFFLLMWLVNATTEEQRKGLADYFSPSASLVHSNSGSGLPFGGRSPFDQGEMVSDRGTMSVSPGRAMAPPGEIEPDSDTSAQMLAPNEARNAGLEQGTASGNAFANGPQSGPKAPGGGPAAQQAPNAAQAAASGAAEQTASTVANLQRTQKAEQEAAAFRAAAEQLREAVKRDPTLAEAAGQLAIDITPEGLRIQIIDEEKKPMFATGSSVPLDRARLLLLKVAPVIAKLPEPVTIAGYTDAAPYRGGERTNWELSAERANATRRLLVGAGLPEGRVRSVTGYAERDPLLPADPLAAANRRVAIVVQRSAEKS